MKTSIDRTMRSETLACRSRVAAIGTPGPTISRTLSNRTPSGSSSSVVRSDEDVDRPPHALRDIGMQVQGCRDRHAGADDLTHPLEQNPVGIVLLGRQIG